MSCLTSRPDECVGALVYSGQLNQGRSLGPAGCCCAQCPVGPMLISTATAPGVCDATRSSIPDSAERPPRKHSSCLLVQTPGQGQAPGCGSMCPHLFRRPLRICAHEEQPIPWNACLMCPRTTILNTTWSIVTTPVPRHTTVAGARNQHLPLLSGTHPCRSFIGALYTTTAVQLHPAVAQALLCSCRPG